MAFKVSTAADGVIRDAHFAYKSATNTRERSLLLEGARSNYLTQPDDANPLDCVRERDGVVAWLNDGNVHATWARRDEQVPYYFCSATCTKQFIIDWEEPIMRYEFYPGRSDVVIVHTFRGVYAVELDGRTQRNIQPFLEDMIVDFRVRDNDTLVVFDGRTYRETSW